MTTPFADQQRERASAAGEPLRRMAYAPISPLRPIRYVISAADGKLVVADLEEDTQRDADLDLLTALLDTYLESIKQEQDDKRNKIVNENPPQAIGLAFTTERTRRTLIASLDKQRRAAAAGDFRAATLWRQFSFTASTPASTVAPALDQALRLGYWAPTETETDTVQGWSTAFGISDLDVTQRLAALIELATAGHKPRGGYGPGMGRSEASGVRASGYASTRASTHAFKRLVDVEACWSGIVGPDPLLLPLNLAAGTVSSVELLDISGQLAHVVMGEGCRFKMGKPLTLFDAALDVSHKAYAAPVIIETMRADQESGLVATMVLRSKSVARTILQSGSKSMYAVEDPFRGPVRQSPLNGRWIDDVTPTRRLDVPAEVILAGAPDHT